VLRIYLKAQLYFSYQQEKMAQWIIIGSPDKKAQAIYCGDKED